MSMVVEMSLNVMMLERRRWGFCFYVRFGHSGVRVTTVVDEPALQLEYDRPFDTRGIPNFDRYQIDAFISDFKYVMRRRFSQLSSRTLLVLPLDGVPCSVAVQE